LEKSYLNWFRSPQIFDVILEVTWHNWRQNCGIIVIFWDPIGNLVQRQENAWRAPVITVEVFLTAWSKVTTNIDIDVANHSSRWFIAIVAIVDVLAATRSQSRVLVG
jgi:hypothetical protein